MVPFSAVDRLILSPFILQATQDFTVKQVPLGNELITDPPPSVESMQEVTRFKLFRKKYAVSAGFVSNQQIAIFHISSVLQYIFNEEESNSLLMINQFT